MPHVDSFFPSKYLKSADLGGKVVRVVIDRIDVEDVGDGEKKPVLYFVGKERGLVLNRANADTLSSNFGPETNDWGGQEMELFVDPNVYMSGKKVGGLRLRAPQRNRIANPPPQRVVPRQIEPEAEQFDERNPPESDVPF